MKKVEGLAPKGGLANEGLAPEDGNIDIIGKAMNLTKENA